MWSGGSGGNLYLVTLLVRLLSNDDVKIMLSQCNLLIKHSDSKNNNIYFFNEERLRVSVKM